MFYAALQEFSNLGKTDLEQILPCVLSLSDVHQQPWPIMDARTTQARTTKMSPDIVTSREEVEK